MQGNDHAVMTHRAPHSMEARLLASIRDLATQPTELRIFRLDEPKEKLALHRILHVSRLQFCEGAEEMVIAPIGPSWAAAFSSSVGADATPVQMALRTGDSLSGAAQLAIHFTTATGAPLVVVLLAPAGSDLVPRASAWLRRQTSTAVCAFGTPAGPSRVKRDNFWGTSYGGLIGRLSPDGPYQVYRGFIDHVIEEVLLQTLRLDAAATPAAARQTPLEGLRVAELCAGDGALASKLLRGPLGKHIRTYLLLERNRPLVEKARRKLAAWEQRGIVSIRAADALADAPPAEAGGDASCGFGLEQSVDVWLASGSVLNGQVGAPADTELVLRRMAAHLAPGGVVMVTGFSTSFLHPELLHDVGLAHAACASLPSTLASGAIGSPAAEEPAAALAAPSSWKRRAARLWSRQLAQSRLPNGHLLGRFQIFVLARGASCASLAKPAAAPSPLLAALAGADLGRTASDRAEPAAERV